MVSSELNSQNKIEFQNFLTHYKFDLKIRNSNGSDYYHTYLNNPFIKKEIYVGKVRHGSSDIQSDYAFKILYSEFKHTINAISKITYDLSCLNNKEVQLIDLYRFFYFQSLRKLSKTDMSNFEENRFTKYVVGTTNVEGNTYSLLETDLTLNHGVTVAGKSSTEFFEIYNYSNLKKYLKQYDNRSIRFDLNFIKKLHSLIYNGIDDEYSGEFRRFNVAISGSETTLSHPMEIEEHLESLCNWYKKHEKIMHPIELIGIFHHRFEQIHPFTDGNGRVGREIMRLQLKQFNLPLIFVNNSNREEYLTALRSSDNDDIKSLIRFIYKSVIGELANLVFSLFMELNQIILSFPKEPKAKNLSISDVLKQILLINQDPKLIWQVLDKYKK